MQVQEIHCMRRRGLSTIMPTDGQKRRLRSLHAAYLTLIFTILADHLFRHENIPEAHDLDAPKINSSLLLAIETFDTNWLKLKHDCRVSGQPTIPKGPQTERPEQKVGAPDMWCAIVQARALLALALARAALVTSDCGGGKNVIEILVGNTNSRTEDDTENSRAVDRAKEHLTEAAELAGWTWWNRIYCSRKAKDVVVTWHDGFRPTSSVIESGVLYVGQTSREYGDDVLREPVFTGLARVELRWDYQCTDLDVAYIYDLAGMY